MSNESQPTPKKDHSGWFGVTPRRWQKEALEEIRYDHRENGTYRGVAGRKRGGIVRATTGSGKSLLLRAFVYPWPFRSTLIVVPTIALVEQLRATLSVIGDIGVFYGKEKEPAQITITTISSLPKLAELPLRWNVIVFDECHRSETPRVLAAVDTLKHPDDNYVIGFSATPYRAKPTAKLSLYDRVIYTYSPTDAVRDGVCVPYRLSLPPVGLSLDEATLWGVRDAVRRYGGFTVVSAPTIKDAEYTAALLRETGFRCVEVHSRTKKNDEAMAHLMRGEIEVIVHVALLQEGVDYPNLCALVSRRKVGSDVRITQEVGRILRVAEGKTEARWYDLHGVSIEKNLFLDPALWEEVGVAVLREDKHTDALLSFARSLGTSTKNYCFGYILDNPIPETVLVVSSLEDVGLDAEDIGFLRGTNPQITLRELRPAIKSLVGVGLFTGNAFLLKAAERGWKIAYCVEGLNLAGLDRGRHILVTFTDYAAEEFREEGWTVRSLDAVAPDPPEYTSSNDEALGWLRDNFLYLVQIGEIVVKKPLSEYARKFPATLEQQNCLNYLCDIARRKPPPQKVLGGLRAASIEGIKGKLRMGPLSDLLTTLKYYIGA